jgi:hypothetical protein
LTIGTPELNHKRAESIGAVVFNAVPGDPLGAPDEADVTLNASITDVRRAGDLADYTGQLEAVVNLRVTDRINGTLANEGGTVADIPLSFTVPCAETPVGDVGATCATTTSVDAITPGFVHEDARSLWELGQVMLMDGGPDGLAATANNSPFAVQGLFAP